MQTSIRVSASSDDAGERASSGSTNLASGDLELGADATAAISVSVGQSPPSESVRFAAFGDYGEDGPDPRAVADLVNSLNPDFIVTMGDNSYGSTPIDLNIGQYYSGYIGNYQGAFGPGSPSNRYFPALGNHDWKDGGGLDAYLNYFTLPGDGVAASGSSGNERYYDFTIGPVHFFALDSDKSEPDGRKANSIQGQWLEAQLAASTAPFQIVYMHHAPYSSSSKHGSKKRMQWPFEDWGADAVLAGHDHTYERIVRDDNNDGVDVPYFVAGLGGRSISGFPASGFVEGSAARYADDFGTMLVEASDTGIVFEFYSTAGGGTLIDSYTIGLTPNRAPAAVGDSAVTAEDKPVAIPVLDNDLDPDNDNLTIVSVTPGANGAVVINRDDTLNFTPDLGFRGRETFSYTIDDGNGHQDTASVSVSVIADM